MINATPPGSVEDDRVLEVEFVVEENVLEDEEVEVLEVEEDVLEVGASTLGGCVLVEVGGFEGVVVLEVVVEVEVGDESFGQWVKVLSLFAAWVRSAFSLVHTLQQKWVKNHL